MAADWHPPLNNTTPADVTCGSSRKAWWLCKKGLCGHDHVWQTKSINRVTATVAVPSALARSHATAIYWQLFIKRLCKQQWDYSVKPEDLLPQSRNRFQWRCSLHPSLYRWQAVPMVASANTAQAAQSVPCSAGPNWVHLCEVDCPPADWRHT